MLFLPQSEEEQLIIKDKINRLIEQEGQVLLGWRSVPVIDEKSEYWRKRVAHLFIRYLFRHQVK